MYLYELALETGERSTDLAQRAQALGLDGASPSTMLTGPQAVALRSGLPMPPAGGGPLTAPAPASPAPDTATGAAPGAGPLSWATNEPAPPPPLTPPPPSAGDPGAGAPGAPGAAGPGPSFIAPPPPGTGGPVRSSLAPPPGIPGAVPAATEGRSRRPSPSQLLAAGLVVVLLAGMAVLMVSHSRANEERQRELVAANARADAKTKAEAEKEAAAVRERLAEEATSTTMAPTTAAPTVPRPIIPPSGVVDQARFCAGGRIMAAFELRMSADAFDGSDWATAVRTVRDGRARWRGAVDEMIASTAGSLQGDVTVYRDTYETFIGAVVASSSRADVAAAFQNIPLDRLVPAARNLNQSLTTSCS